MAANCSSGMRPTLKTPYGHTAAQSPFPSQRRASTTGLNAPGSALQRGVLSVLPVADEWCRRCRGLESTDLEEAMASIPGKGGEAAHITRLVAPDRIGNLR